MTGRRRRRLLMRALRARRFVGRHYVSLISAAVIAMVGAVALTDEGAGDGSRSTGETSNAVQSPLPATVTPGHAPPTPVPWPTLAEPREIALVFLVTDELQAASVAETFNSLVWDTSHYDPYQAARTPRIHCLVAGTRDSESRAIQELNTMITLARMQDVDLRVVDLRPEKGPGADHAAP